MKQGGLFSFVIYCAGTSIKLSTLFVRNTRRENVALKWMSLSRRNRSNTIRLQSYFRSPSVIALLLGWSYGAAFYNAFGQNVGKIGKKKKL